MALPVNPDPTDRRAAVLRMLEESPEGLTDAALARQLGDVRPQTVNQLCRRLVAEGALERVGSRPIVNRLPAPPATPRRRGRKKATAPVEPVRADQGAAQAPGPGPKPRRRRTKEPAATPAAVEALPSVPTENPAESSTELTTELTAEPPAEQDAAAVAATPDDVGADPAPTPPDPHDTEPTEPTEPAEPAASAEPAGDGGDVEAEPETSCGPPPYDLLQAWSRVVNVQSLVAGWLVRRGATLRWASVEGTGPARDLVASLDGDDVHVEVTGWPADGARTHPTTIAGDWFAAAEHAAVERRRAHPRARIVIALPDTRRYRSLTEQHATSLDGARAEVWFVDAAGAVHAR